MEVVGGGRSPPASSEAPMRQSSAECIAAGCIHHIALPCSQGRLCCRACSRQLPTGLCGSQNGNDGEWPHLWVVTLWGPQPSQLLCVAALAGCSREAALVKQMLVCSPHFLLPGITLTWFGR